MKKVEFHYQTRKFTLKNRTALKRKLALIFEQEKKKLDRLTVVFCTDDYLLSLNKDFLNHDYYTDILTFPYHDQSQAVIGELYISVERVTENAKSQKTTFSDEIQRVMIHGTLHLCGYDDKTKRGSKIMTEKEDFYLHMERSPSAN